MDKIKSNRGDGVKKRYYCTSSHPFGLEMHVWNRIWIPPTHLLGFYGMYLVISASVPWTVLIPSKYKVKCVNNICNIWHIS